MDVQPFVIQSSPSRLRFLGRAPGSERVKRSGTSTHISPRYVRWHCKPWQSFMEVEGQWANMGKVGSRLGRPRPRLLTVCPTMIIDDASFVWELVLPCRERER